MQFRDFGFWNEDEGRDIEDNLGKRIEMTKKNEGCSSWVFSSFWDRKIEIAYQSSLHFLIEKSREEKTGSMVKMIFILKNPFVG